MALKSRSSETLEPLRELIFLPNRQMKNQIQTVAANITYSGATFNTRLVITYKHTGPQFFYKKKGQKHETFTESETIASERKSQGLKVRETSGHWFIERLAIPTINAKGEKDIWYINNPGDNYRINKISKYGKKIHQQLSIVQP